MTNVNPAMRFLMLFDQTALPAAGATPTMTFACGGGAANFPTVLLLDVTFFAALNAQGEESGVPFSSGIAWAISTTPATFTDGANPADHTVNVVFT